MAELSERKKLILAAVVEQYIKTGEPIGSKELLALTGMSVSSATVRNEMSELAAMGYLEQPHTSAGRIPSQTGYRYYVDNLMKPREIDELNRRMIEAGISSATGDPERLIAQAGEVLADLTKCACVSIEKLYEAFQLPKKTQIRRFSKGMQKQAAFHLTLCLRPDLLVLDEPVDGLDPVMRRQVMSLILSEVVQNETTVLISSHNLRELEDICDHVGIMDHGKMLLQRSLEDMQGNTVKLQLVGTVPEGLPVLHESSSGRLKTLIVRGSAAEVSNQVSALSPAYFDVLPLSLEEIFIYELGGVDYAVKDIIL